MHKRRLIPFLGLFLLLAGGPSMQMIEPAYATCCAPPRCGCCWQYMVYGSISMLENGKATISTGKGFSRTVDVSQDIQRAFKGEEPPITQDFGFIVLTGDMEQEQAQVVAFVGADRVLHNNFANDKKVAGSAQTVVNEYNKAFEDFLNETFKQTPKQSSK